MCWEDENLKLIKGCDYVKKKQFPYTYEKLSRIKIIPNSTYV